MSIGVIVEDLLTHLRLEVEHVDEQKRVLLKERESLISQDLEGILDCINMKEALKTQAMVLDESRKVLRERLADSLGMEREEVTLTTLAERMDEPKRSRLLKFKWQIENLLGQVDDLSDGNRYLIRTALGHVSRSLGLLGLFQQGRASTYDEEGRISGEGSPASRLEQQV